VLDLGDALRGQAADALDLDAARALADAAIEPDADIHATAAYRRHLAGVLLGRGLQAAATGADTATGPDTTEDAT
jgi:aerobic carbon-monoxide dehydrogenase medium subunit